MAWSRAAPLDRLWKIFDLIESLFDFGRFGFVRVLPFQGPVVERALFDLVAATKGFIALTSLISILTSAHEVLTKGSQEFFLSEAL